MLKTNRRFGLELEFALPYQEFSKTAKKIISKIIGKDSYVAKDEKYSVERDFNKWHIKRENDSVSEINTPISRWSDIPKINKVIGKLGEKKIPIDKDCGYHIHIEVKDINKISIIGFWLQCEKGILDCFPMERRKNVSVEKLIKNKFDSKKLVAAILEHSVNCASHGDIISLRDYEDRKTVEFRIAESTTDTKMITYWTKFLLYWLEYIKTMEPSFIPCRQCNSLSMDEIVDKIGVDNETRDFMLWRFRKYHSLPYWVK